MDKVQRAILSGNIDDLKAALYDLADSTYSVKVEAQTATFTASAENNAVFLCDATAAAVVVNLPSAVGISGRQFTVKKTDASVNTVTIDPNGTETVDGAATRALSAQHASVTIVSNGANWFVVE